MKFEVIGGETNTEMAISNKNGMLMIKMGMVVFSLDIERAELLYIHLGYPEDFNVNILNDIWFEVGDVPSVNQGEEYYREFRMGPECTVLSGTTIENSLMPILHKIIYK